MELSSFRKYSSVRHFLLSHSYSLRRPSHFPPPPAFSNGVVRTCTGFHLSIQRPRDPRNFALSVKSLEGSERKNNIQTENRELSSESSREKEERAEEEPTGKNFPSVDLVQLSPSKCPPSCPPPPNVG